MRRRATSLLALFFLLHLVFAGAAGAVSEEVRRVEAVGAFPIDPKRAAPMAPRDAAVRAAVRDAVLRIALALLPAEFAAPVPEEETGEGAEAGPEAEPDAPPDSGPVDTALEAWLDRVLGEDPFEFATRFRILEDRGVRPALLSGSPNVESEYVVVVEVYVDVGRVVERLRASGALLTPAGGENRFQVQIVAEGVGSYAAYDALRRALVAGPGVRSALAVELRRGRVVFAVDAEREASAVLDDLLTAAPAGLHIIPLESKEDSVTVLVDWSEPEIEEEAEDGPAAP